MNISHRVEMKRLVDESMNLCSMEFVFFFNLLYDRFKMYASNLPCLYLLYMVHSGFAYHIFYINGSNASFFFFFNIFWNTVPKNLFSLPSSLLSFGPHLKRGKNKKGGNLYQIFWTCQNKYPYWPNLKMCFILH